MSSCYGEKIKVSVFGQSHGQAIGVTIDGMPAGEAVDIVKLKNFTDRRKPGKSKLETARKESDEPQFLSGIENGMTCGAPICAVIYNRDAKSSDYSEISKIMRPSHADYTAFVKYGGNADIRGGGHFSGRLTAPLCIAGGIAMQILERRGISVKGRIFSIGGIKDVSLDMADTKPSDFEYIDDINFPVFDKDAESEMKAAIEKAREQIDSVGGIVECFVFGMPCGAGAPMFEGMEGKIASAVFGIPGVKGVEFGSGFGGSDMMGSQNNDEFYVKDGVIKTYTNNSGGILGGISTGMPIVFRAAFKPTPSIGKAQRTVDVEKMENVTLELKGRHDPCIAVRAVPCVEAAAALAVLDILMQDGFIR